MNESILTTIKKMLGIEEDYEAFDTDIMVHINSVFMTLHQLGVGPRKGFSISGDRETWGRFVRNKMILNGVKTYIYLKVRLLFDPPTNSFTIDAINRQIAELEWRLNHQVESERDYDEDAITFGEIDDMFEEIDTLFGKIDNMF